MSHLIKCVPSIKFPWTSVSDFPLSTKKIEKSASEKNKVDLAITGRWYLVQLMHLANWRIRPSYVFRQVMPWIRIKTYGVISEVKLIQRTNILIINTGKTSVIFARQVGIAHKPLITRTLINFKKKGILIFF